jgi:hypothetical protein
MGRTTAKKDKMPATVDNELIDEDETTPIANLIRNTDGVVDIMDEEKSKMFVKANW